MLQSKYVLDIFDLSFDGLESGDLLRKQTQFLSEDKREHTQVGIYVYFRADKEIEKYKIPIDKASDLDNDGNPTEMLIGVEIKNEDLNILADATVHLKNGLLSHIEIWNKNGEDYPTADPAKYELTQLWLDKSKRRTLIR